MNRFKFQAFVEEFSFLAEVFIPDEYGYGDKLDQENCDEITVQRIDAQLLNAVPKTKKATGSRVGVNNYERVDFVLRNGEVIRDAVKCDLAALHHEAHVDNEHRRGESVLEAIDQYRIGEDLQYIVWIMKGYVIRNHYSQSNWRATIYKPAKGDIVTDLLTEAKAMAAEEVKAETAF